MTHHHPDHSGNIGAFEAAGLPVAGSVAMGAALDRFSGAAGPLAFGDRGKLDPRTDFGGVLGDPAAFAKKVRLLWLGVGTAEPERMRAGIRSLHASLTEAGIAHVYQEAEGTDHEWQTWRRNLNDFAPRLFR